MPRESLEPRADEVARAAEVSVLSALQLRAKERFVVLHDRASLPTAMALAECALAAGADVRTIDLSRAGPRPVRALPDWVTAELAEANASVFVAAAHPAELGLRQQVLHTVARHGLRHAHMPGITALAFCRGQRIDYGRVAACGQRLLTKLRGVKVLETHSPSGTALRIALDDSCVWYPQLGRLAPGRWGNLPAGALYASPARVDGVYVANASLGEYFGAREGDLSSQPVRFRVENSRVTELSVPGSTRLGNEIETMLRFAENSDRIGLVCIGVNYGIAEATGEALVDQNLPGLHLAIGDPAAKVTGASWTARTSFAACGSNATVLADGLPLVVRGKLLDTN